VPDGEPAPGGSDRDVDQEDRAPSGAADVGGDEQTVGDLADDGGDAAGGAEPAKISRS
jgi:hypothetical protein